MARGPGYTVADLVYWAGFILTTAVVTLLLREYTDWHRLVTVLVGIGCGIVVGMAALYLYKKMQGDRRPPQDERPGNKDGWL